MSVAQIAVSSTPEQSVRRQVLTLAWPAVLEMMLNMSVGLADTYIVGHLGASSLAAVGLSMQSLQLFWSLFGAIGVGSTALVARYIGAKQPQEANKVAQQSMLLAFVVGLMTAVVLWIGAPSFLSWLGAEPEVVELGTNYIHAVASTVFLNAVLLVGSAILRGSGDTRTPMFIMLVINVINIVVAYSLTHGLSFLPALGVLGSGIGAATARALGGLIMLVVLVRGRRLVKIGFKIPRLDWAVIGRVLRIGLPAAGEQLLMRFGQLVLATFITDLGTVSYAAHQVAINALSVAYMPGWGFALAATTLVGQELGAKRPDRASRSVLESIRMVLLVMGVMGGLVAIFPEQVMSTFSNDIAVIAAGVPALRIAGIAMPMLGLAFTLAGSLRGAGDTTAVLFVYGGCIWAVRVANSYWLGPILGLTGIWIALSVDFLVRAVLLGWRFRTGKWKFIEV